MGHFMAWRTLRWCLLNTGFYCFSTFTIFLQITSLHGVYIVRTETGLGIVLVSRNICKQVEMNKFILFTHLNIIYFFLINICIILTNKLEDWGYNFTGLWFLRGQAVKVTTLLDGNLEQKSILIVPICKCR